MIHNVVVLRVPVLKEHVEKYDLVLQVVLGTPLSTLGVAATWQWGLTNVPR